MNKNKKLILGLVFIVSVFLTYRLVYFLAENYFFDKIFYQKSYNHGYFYNDFFDKTFLHALIFRGRERTAINRSKDLAFLLKQEPNSKRYDPQKTKEKFKVAFIGDSFVYGLGVKESERTSNILEDKLNQIRPSIVYNFGNMGDNLVDNYIKYNLAKEHMDIDLFIFGLVDDDFNYVEHYDDYPNFKKTLDDLSEGCKELKVGYGELMGKQIVNPISVREDEINYLFYPMVMEEKYGNLCVARKIVESFDSNHTMAFNFNYFYSVMMTQQSHIENEYTHKFNILIDKYLRVFKDAGIKIIDGPNEVFSIYPDENPHVSKAEGHPSKFAHYQYAQKLFEEITNNPKWGFIEN